MDILNLFRPPPIQQMFRDIFFQIYASGFMIHVGVYTSVYLIRAFRETIIETRSTETSFIGRYLIAQHSLTKRLIIYSLKGFLVGILNGLMWPITIGPSIIIGVF